MIGRFSETYNHGDLTPMLQNYITKHSFNVNIEWLVYTTIR